MNAASPIIVAQTRRLHSKSSQPLSRSCTTQSSKLAAEPRPNATPIAVENANLPVLMVLAVPNPLVQDLQIVGMGEAEPAVLEMMHPDGAERENMYRSKERSLARRGQKRCF